MENCRNCDIIDKCIQYQEGLDGNYIDTKLKKEINDKCRIGLKTEYDELYTRIKGLEMIRALDENPNEYYNRYVGQIIFKRFIELKEILGQ